MVVLVQNKKVSMPLPLKWVSLLILLEGINFNRRTLLSGKINVSFAVVTYWRTFIAYKYSELLILVNSEFSFRNLVYFSWIWHRNSSQLGSCALILKPATQFMQPSRTIEDIWFCALDLSNVPLLAIVVHGWLIEALNVFQEHFFSALSEFMHYRPNQMGFLLALLCLWSIDAYSAFPVPLFPIIQVGLDENIPITLVSCIWQRSR